MFFLLLMGHGNYAILVVCRQIISALINLRRWALKKITSGSTPLLHIELLRFILKISSLSPFSVCSTYLLLYACLLIADVGLVQEGGYQ